MSAQNTNSNRNDILSRSRAFRRIGSILLVLTLSVTMGQSGTCGINNGGDNNGGNNGGGGNGGGSNTITILADDHVMGSPNAPVTVVEYSDFQCPFCGKFARQEFPVLKANYIDTGKARFVFRHLPIRNSHPRAENCARASECASDQGDFFEYHDKIFNTPDIGFDNTVPTDAQLRQYAADMGMNLTTFDACYPPGDGKASRVQRDVNSASALQVSGTPTFFVNGRRHTTGNTAAKLGEAIDRAINGG